MAEDELKENQFENKVETSQEATTTEELLLPPWPAPRTRPG